jgi:hypothetical protein
MGSKVALEADVLEAWRIHSTVPNQVVADLKGVFKYRHWLAHGRYWTPKFAQKKYGFRDIYTLAQMVFDDFPFEGL